MSVGPGGPQGPGSSPEPGETGTLAGLCRRAVELLGADGAVVQAVSADGLGQPAASWGFSHQVTELEFELGEGPGRDAFATGLPVLVPDVDETTHRWPGLADAAVRLGVRSIYAFPIAVGAARLGVLVVYGRRPQQLPTAGLRSGAALAEEGVDLLLDRFDPPPTWMRDARFVNRRDGPGSRASWADGLGAGSPREEVYQAQGMVMVDLGVALPVALARLRAHAFATDRSLSDVAHDVVSGRLRLTVSPPGFAWRDGADGPDAADGADGAGPVDPGT